MTCGLGFFVGVVLKEYIEGRVLPSFLQLSTVYGPSKSHTDNNNNNNNECKSHTRAIHEPYICKSHTDQTQHGRESTHCPTEKLMVLLLMMDVALSVM